MPCFSQWNSFWNSWNCWAVPSKSCSVFHIPEARTYLNYGVLLSTTGWKLKACHGGGLSNGLIKLYKPQLAVRLTPGVLNQIKSDPWLLVSKKGIPALGMMISNWKVVSGVEKHGWTTNDSDAAVLETKGRNGEALEQIEKAQHHGFFFGTYPYGSYGSRSNLTLPPKIDGLIWIDHV